jgi:hypothetical protein
MVVKPPLQKVLPCMHCRKLRLVTFSSVCANEAEVMLTGGLPAGGTFSGSGVSDNKFSPDVVGTGTYSIKYIYKDNNDCKASASKNITVHALPEVSLGELSSICVNAAEVTLTGGLPAGGTFSGSGVSANKFSAATAGVGTYDIKYVYTDNNGCEASTSKSITVHAIPEVILEQFLSVCANATEFTLTGGLPAGGTFSGSGVNGSKFSPIVVGMGTYTITYVYIDNNGCEASASESISVMGLPDVSLSEFPLICADAEDVVLTGGLPSGGTFSGIGVDAGSFSAFTAGPGTHRIIYTYTNANNCVNSDTVDLTVINVNKPTISTNFDNPEAPVLTSSTTAGNQWYHNGTAIVGATQSSYTVASPGSYSVQVQTANCSSEISEEVVIIITGIMQAESSNMLSAHPSPAEQQITISIPGATNKQITRIEIINIDGKVVYQNSVTSNQAMVQIADYTPGVYVVKAIGKNHRQSVRFIKK